MRRGFEFLKPDLDEVLLASPYLWPRFEGRRLFVTGGTGFFGCWLLETLCHAIDALALDCQVTVLTRRPEAMHLKAPHLAGHASVRLQEGDVLSLVPNGERYTHVLHAATDSATGLDTRDPDLMHRTIEEGTRRALKFAAESGAKRFLLTSSGAVYGAQPPDVTHVSESSPLPKDGGVYARAKRIAEELCLSEAGLDTTVARCFAFAGPYLPLDAHFAIGNFIGDALGGRPIQVNGDGTSLRSYLYGSDLALWLWSMLLDQRAHGVYNVGSDEATSIRRLADVVSHHVGTGEVMVRDEAPQGSIPHRYVPSVEKARAELDLIQRVSLSSAIRRTAQWQRARNLSGAA